LKTFESLGCRTFGRVDFKLGPDRVPYCLEVNTIPGMTETSLVPKVGGGGRHFIQRARQENRRAEFERKMNLNFFAKSLKKMKKQSVLLLLILSVGLVYTLFDSKGLIQRIRLAGEKAALEEKIEKLEKEDASMREEIRKLQTSDQEIERIAREKYFMHRNGEKIIKVEPK